MVQILKQAAFILLAFAAFLPLVFDARSQNAGLRRLTFAGYCVLGMTLGAIALNIVVDRWEKQAEEAEEFTKAAAEARVTREIIVSGQRLRSLRAVWTFTGVPTRYSAPLAAAQEEIARELREGASTENGPGVRSFWEHRSRLQHDHLIYPWIGALGRWSRLHEGADVILSIGLDHSQSVVLPLGYLRTGKDANTSASVEIANFSGERSRAHEYSASMQVDGSRITLDLNLSPPALEKSLDNASQVPAYASFPPRLRVLVFNHADTSDGDEQWKELTFDSTNTAELHNLPWLLDRDAASTLPPVCERSELVLCPNDLEDYTATYEMTRMGPAHVSINYPYLDVSGAPIGTIWEGRRLDRN